MAQSQITDQPMAPWWRDSVHPHGGRDTIKVTPLALSQQDDCKARKDLGDNCIRNFHLGRYIVGYTVRNLVLRPHASGAVKRDFQTYIWQYTFPNENFEYGYPNFNVLLQFHLQFEHCKPHKAAHHPTKCDVINDVKLFPTVYCRIHCHQFLTLFNQTSHYKSMCIRIQNNGQSEYDQEIPQW